MRRGLLTAAIGVAFAALPVATSPGATVAGVCCQPAIVFQAASGERNTVTWTVDAFDPVDLIYITGPDLVLSDATAKVTAIRPNCRQLGPHSALCPEYQGRIYLGDGDDYFGRVSSNDHGDRYYGPQFLVEGGPGNDRLEGFGLGLGAASLYGGDGNDVIISGSYISGGAGNDRIVLLNGYNNDPYSPTSLSCGPGVDTVVAPKGDPLPADCEKFIQLPAGL